MELKKPMRIDFIYKFHTPTHNRKIQAYYLNFMEEDISAEMTLESIKQSYLKKEEVTVGNWCYNNGKYYIGESALEEWVKDQDVDEEEIFIQREIQRMLKELISDTE